MAENRPRTNICELETVFLNNSSFQRCGFLNAFFHKLTATLEKFWKGTTALHSTAFEHWKPSCFNGVHLFLLCSLQYCGFYPELLCLNLSQQADFYHHSEDTSGRDSPGRIYYKGERNHCAKENITENHSTSELQEAVEVPSEGSNVILKTLGIKFKGWGVKGYESTQTAGPAQGFCNSTSPKLLGTFRLFQSGGPHRSLPPSTGYPARMEKPLVKPKWNYHAS